MAVENEEIFSDIVLGVAKFRLKSRRQYQHEHLYWDNCCHFRRMSKASFHLPREEAPQIEHFICIETTRLMLTTANRECNNFQLVIDNLH